METPKPKLTPAELRDEIISLLDDIHGTNKKTFYQTANISVEFKCSETKLWNYDIWIRGKVIDMTGCELTYAGIVALVTVVLLAVAEACNQTTPPVVKIIPINTSTDSKTWN